MSLVVKEIIFLVVINKGLKAIFKNADMSNVKNWKNQFGCIIKGFKESLSALS